MDPNPDRTDELAALCTAAVEGRLTDAERRRLERLVLDDPAARRWYVEYLHQHACLHWSAAEPAFVAPAAVNPKSQTPNPKPQTPNRKRSVWGLGFGVSRAAGVAAAVLVAAGAWLALAPRGPGVTVATLARAQACKWDAGTLPTEAGARLGAGRLRLAEGLARIVFDNGAEVSLEGPADLEVVSPSRCVLHAGRLVARVPSHAVGFVVDTPTATLNDLGTSFGVNVSDDRTADVQVFEGRVDATHRASGRTEAMRSGKGLRFAADAVSAFDQLQERPPSAPRADGSVPPDARVVQLSTATGRGKDAYVQPVITPDHQSDILLLVKNTSATGANQQYYRKAYIGLDLAALAGRRVLDAQLTLTLAPTSMGFASEVPDATFSLYGLTDEALDDWDEAALRWQNAPANQPGGAALDPAKVVRLGSFVVEQGVTTGVRAVGGPALADFLNRDTNGLATFILVRDTRGSGRSDLVHGFANKRHPNLPPPTLKVTVVPKR
jgi:ferric-dicitrate binding protein FerR (iron transport regulator)